MAFRSQSALNRSSSATPAYPGCSCIYIRSRQSAEALFQVFYVTAWLLVDGAECNKRCNKQAMDPYAQSDNAGRPRQRKHGHAREPDAGGAGGVFDRQLRQRRSRTNTTTRPGAARSRAFHTTTSAPPPYLSSPSRQENVSCRRPTPPIQSESGAVHVRCM